MCKIDEKTIQKRCENELRKSDAQMMKNDAKMEPKLNQKPVQIQKKLEKRHAKIDAKI